MVNIEKEIVDLIYKSIIDGYIRETDTGKAVNKSVIYEKFKRLGITKRKTNEILIEFNIVETEYGKATKHVKIDGKGKRCIVISDDFISKNKFIF